MNSYIPTLPTLSLLEGTNTGTRKNRKKKALVKAKEAAKEALAKVADPKSESKEAEEATKVTNDTLKAGFQADLVRGQANPGDCQGRNDRCRK